MNDPPIACRLTDPELARRRQDILARLFARAQEERPTDSGLGLRFPAAADIVAELGRFIEEERNCCPFLDFRLEVARDGGPIWLHMSGPTGTREFLQELLSDD